MDFYSGDVDIVAFQKPNRIILRPLDETGKALFEIAELPTIALNHMDGLPFLLITLVTFVYIL